MAVAALGAAELRIDTSTASFLDKTSPKWQTYVRSVERHGTDEFIVVAVDCAEPWDRSALRRVVNLTNKLEQVPGVSRVDSLASVPLIRNDMGALMVNSGLAGGVAESGEAFERFVEVVKNDRIARDSLVSRDGRVFAINVLVENQGEVDWGRVVNDVRQLAALDGGRVTGVPVFRTEVNSRMSGELKLFIPATLLLIALIMWILVPEPSALLAPLLVSGASMLCAVGAMGYWGVTMSLSTMLLPSTLLALGSAYAMHVVVARGNVESLAEVAFPLALSGFTTTIGFVSMSVIPISAIRELGVFGAFGIVVGTAAALTLAPAVLALFPVEDRRSRFSDWVGGDVSDRLNQLVASRRRTVLVTWLALVMAGGVGLAQLEVSTDIVKWFSPSSDVRIDYEHVRSRLSGISPVSVLIEAKSDDAPDVHSAELVAAIDALSMRLSDDNDVGKSLSVGDPLRLVRAAYTESEVDTLPVSDAEIQQSLLLLSGMDRLTDVLSPDRRSASILLRVNNNSSDDIVGLTETVERWWEERGHSGYRVEVTGIMYEFARSEEEISRGQIQGLAIAAASIATILLLVFRSGRVAAIAFVANATPIAIGFGALGLLGIPLDAGTICVSSLALGIAVDDTIHVVTSYRRARAGGSRGQALLTAYRRVLPALVMTTAAVSVGFAVLSFSNFSLVRNLGMVTSSLIILCLVADVTLLPALLLGSSRKEGAARK